MPHIDNLDKMDANGVLNHMNNVADGPNSRPFETMRTAIQVKSISALMKSIDDFRKSNERTSRILIVLTAVLGFATCVQAFYALILLFKK
jgi:hypothetical protein